MVRQWEKGRGTLERVTLDVQSRLVRWKEAMARDEFRRNLDGGMNEDIGHWPELLADILKLLTLYNAYCFRSLGVEILISLWFSFLG